MKIHLPYDYGQNHHLPQIAAIVSASLTGVTDGMLFSWTSPAIAKLIQDESNEITIREASYFTVVSSISMGITALLFTKLVDRIGRKKGVLLVSLPQLISWILSGLSQNIWILYASRFFSGMGDALFFSTTPIYVCEIAEPVVRGSWGNVLAISIYLGIFLVNVIGAYFDLTSMALLCGWVPILHVLIFSCMPESPFYLLMKGREEEAIESLRLLRWRHDVDEEIKMLKGDVKRQVSESGSTKDLFTVVSNRKALVMCMGIRIAQQLSGLSAFELYTQYLFKEAGGSVSEELSAMIFSAILLMAVVFSSCFVEKLGRKPLMLFSCLGCGIILTIESVYIAIVEFTSINMSEFGWVPLAGMLAYIVVCATGIGILPTLILGEVFSANIKGKATAIMNITTAACLLIVPKLFQTLTYHFGIFSPFCFFAVSCYAGVIFSYLCVIETKGKTLEEIQQEFKGNASKGSP